MSLDAAHVRDGYEVMGSAMNRWSPYVLSILRIITAFLYMVHGTQKLFGFPARFPVPHLPLLFLAGGMIETFGGLLLLIGLFTRPVGFILSGELAVAYFKFHAPQGFWPLLNDGEGGVLIALSSYYFSRAREGRGALIACCETCINRLMEKWGQTGRSQFFERMAIGERPVCPQFLPVRTCVAD
jgi:putative oxidoreductase